MSQPHEPSSLGQNLLKSVGSVIGKRKRGRPAKPKVALPSEPASPTTGTSVTVMGETTMSPENPLSSISAPTTTANSSFNTDSLMSPNGYVESGSSVNIAELLMKLRPESSVKLQELSEGRSEPLEVTIEEIMRFLCDEESEYAEAPLDEAIEYYLSVSFI